VKCAVISDPAYAMNILLHLLSSMEVLLQEKRNERGRKKKEPSTPFSSSEGLAQ